MTVEYLYRADDTIIDSVAVYDMEGDFSHHIRKSNPEVSFHISQHEIIRRTPKGVWIKDPVTLQPKFILLTANKRWAAETVEQAVRDLFERRKSQVQLLSGQLRRAEASLNELANDLPGIAAKLEKESAVYLKNLEIFGDMLT